MKKKIIQGISIIISLLISSTCFSQDLLNNTGSEKTDLSDPSKISQPPMDAYSLSYTPDMPEGAIDIKTPAECEKAGGKWGIFLVNERLAGALGSELESNEDLGDMLEVPIFEAGCVLNYQREGRWAYFLPKTSAEKESMPSESLIQGYVWYKGGKREGWDVIFNAPKDFVRILRHYSAGELDGTTFAWSRVGSLSAVLTYKKAVLDGRIEKYINCLPLLLGQYKEGVPSGKWDIYGEPGQLEHTVDFDHIAQASELPENTEKSKKAYWTEGYSEKGQFMVSGFSVIDLGMPEVPGLRIGKETFYSTTGNKWLEINYNSAGSVADERIKSLCQPDYATEKTSLSGVNFDHESLTVQCVNASKGIFRQITFYGTGEVWKTEPYKKGKINGMVREYHPTGELLAEYNVIDDIPDGLLVYRDREGQVMGTPEMVKDGNGIYRVWWNTGNMREEGRYFQKEKVGTWKTWFETGNQKTEQVYAERGYSREWYANGILAMDVQQHLGAPDGRVTVYYADGRIGDEMEFDDGSPTGKSYEYYHNGKYKVVQDYSNQIPSITEYYETGEKKAEGKGGMMFDQMIRSGEWRYYLLDGKTVWYKANYHVDKIESEDADACEAMGGEYQINDEEHAVGCFVCQVDRKYPRNVKKNREAHWEWFNESGRLEKKGQIHMGHLDGAWEYYYPNGNKMLEGQYELDRKKGVWKAYFEDGSKKFEGSYKDGVEDGEWLTYFKKNGAISSKGRYENGKRIGTWIWYYENGAVREEGNYEDGLETGVWTTYYSSGKKIGSGLYEKGKRTGDWSWWREDGQEWKKATYFEGKEI